MRGLLVGLALSTASLEAARAAEEAIFRIEMKDGKVTPDRLEVPAGKVIVLEIYNTGTTPAEFESRPLRKETVIAPGGKATLTIKKLDPGTYEFFDDFHPDSSRTLLIAK